MLYFEFWQSSAHDTNYCHKFSKEGKLCFQSTQHAQEPRCKGCLTYHSTAQIAVIKLCRNDAPMFLHFHAFLAALSGMGTLLIPVLTSLKNATEQPVVRTTELNSIAGRCVGGKNSKNWQITAERSYQQTEFP